MVADRPHAPPLLSPASGARSVVTWRFCGALWLLGMPGVLAVLGAVLQPLRSHAMLLPAPWWSVWLVSGWASALLLAAVVAWGAVLAPQVGLSSPVVLAMVRAQPQRRVWLAPLVAGICGGVAGALWSAAGWAIAPEALQTAAAGNAMPWVTRLLYTGITEELLLRWGGMTTLLWCAWRIVQRGRGVPRTPLVVASVVCSALLAAWVQLPATSLPCGSVACTAVAFPLIFHAVWGTVTGALFVRFGLEAAIVAQVVSQALAVLLH